GFVAESFRKEFIEVTENIFLQQFRVKLCHTVNTVSTYTSQIGHPDIFFPSFVDQRHPSCAIVVSWVPSSDFFQKSVIDLENDFHMPGKKRAEQGQRPFLQGFRQQRM